MAYLQALLLILLLLLFDFWCSLNWIFKFFIKLKSSVWYEWRLVGCNINMSALIFLDLGNWFDNHWIAVCMILDNLFSDLNKFSWAFIHIKEWGFVFIKIKVDLDSISSNFILMVLNRYSKFISLRTSLHDTIVNEVLKSWKHILVGNLMLHYKIHELGCFV